MDFTLLEIYNLYKEEFDLNEGLISTTPIGQTIGIISRKINSKGKVYTKEDKENIFYLFFKNNLKHDDWEEIERLINNLGWYPSLFSIEYETQYGIFSKLTKKFNMTIFNSFLNKKTKNIEIKFEAKYDIEIDEKKIPKYLYHVTLKRNLNKIMKLGLAPKSKSKLSAHSERIYFTEDKDSVKIYAKNVKNLNVVKLKSLIIDYVILKVDTTHLPEYFRLFKDPNFKDKGYYTYNNVPPFNLEIVEELTL